MSTVIFGSLLLVIILLISCRYKLKKSVEKTEVKVDEPIEKPRIKEKVKIPEEFHIKVAPYTEKGEYYCIEFTNDDWLTSREIMNARDMSSEVNPLWINYAPYLAKEESCIELAKTFETYQSCVDYNNRVELRYKTLLKWREENPYPQRVVKKPIRKETIIK